MSPRSNVFAFVPFALLVAAANTAPLPPDRDEPLKPLTQQPENEITLCNLHHFAFLPEGKGLLAVEYDLSSAGTMPVAAEQNSLRVWNWLKGSPDRMLCKHSDDCPIYRNLLAVSPDGRRAAYATYADDMRAVYHNINIIDIDKGDTIATFAATPRSRAVTLAFTPDGSRLVSAHNDADHTLRVWDVQKGKELEKIYEGEDPVGSQVFVDGGRQLVAGVGEEIWIWAFPGGKVLHRFSHERFVVGCMASSPDGQLLASGGSMRGRGEVVLLWETRSGKELGLIEAHDSQLNAVAIRKGGDILATASCDKTAKL
jgi:WD40 repeat protein